jgi:hypothetical protein
MKLLLVFGLLFLICDNLHAQTGGYKIITKDIFKDTTSKTKNIPADVVSSIKIVEDYGEMDGEGWNVISDSLKAYIKDNGFVPLFDKDKLPEAMQPYYNSIIDTINHHNQLYLENWYIKLGTFKDNNEGFYFVLYSLSAINSAMREWKKIKAEEERIKAENDTSKTKHILINDYTGPAGYIFSYSKTTHAIKLIYTAY